jgi:hypothetical protein
MYSSAIAWQTAAIALLASGTMPGATPALPMDPPSESVTVKLSEWKVALSASEVSAGPVRFMVVNTGRVPHAFEVEGKGLERETPLIQPGDTATLVVTLKAGAYEAYCPVGGTSHKMLGMETHFSVGGSMTMSLGMLMAKEAMPPIEPGSKPPTAAAKRITVVGGGPVIQILPGPFPFPDSAAATVAEFGDERASLMGQERNGAYSDSIAQVTGTFSLTALDLGAMRDSVTGTAEFKTQDGASWRLILDRVQTKDVTRHPRFGGVIMGLYYHGNTGVHNPLVPTINSKVALWAFGHLWRNGELVTDNAAVHVMLLSRTRRPGDFHLACYDCSRQPVEELQLQVTPAAGQPPLPAPGGFLFLNWERSRGM